MKTTKTTTANETHAAIMAFEAVLIKAAKAGVLKGAAIDAAIVKAGFAFTAEEHAACKPVSAAEQAAAELAAYGIDASALQAETAKANVLAVNLDGIAKACGKYGKYAIVYDQTNGTSCVSHYIINELAKHGKVTLTGTLEFTRKHLPSYSSTGHFNTMKRLLKEHFALNVWQGGFSISSK